MKIENTESTKNEHERWITKRESKIRKVRDGENDYEGLISGVSSYYYRRDTCTNVDASSVGLLFLLISDDPIVKRKKSCYILFNIGDKTCTDIKNISSNSNSINTDYCS